VYYFDETSTHLWEKRQRAWQYSADPMRIKLPPERGTSITVLGAISSHSKRLHWSLGEKTNIDCVMEFMGKLTETMGKYNWICC
jgi:hypothetical protein